MVDYGFCLIFKSKIPSCCFWGVKPLLGFGLGFDLMLKRGIIMLIFQVSVVDWKILVISWWGLRGVSLFGGLIRRGFIEICRVGSFLF